MERIESVHRLAAQLVDQVGIGRRRTHEVRIPAHLARRADGADGLADDGAEHDRVAVRRLHLRHLRREVGGAALEGGLLGERHVDVLEAVFRALQHFGAEVVILIDDAEFLGAALLDHPWNSLAHLGVIGSGEGKLQLVQRLVHFARRRQREEVHHTLVEQGREGGQIDCRADGADHGEKLVLLHHFLGREQAFLRIVAGILGDELQLAAIDAALIVDLVDPHLHAVAQRLAEAGQRARQILDGADDDFILGDAHLLGCHRRGASADSCDCKQGCCQFGGSLHCALLRLPVKTKAVINLVAIHRLDQFGIFLTD